MRNIKFAENKFFNAIFYQNVFYGIAGILTKPLQVYYQKKFFDNSNEIDVLKCIEQANLWRR